MSFIIFEGAFKSIPVKEGQLSSNLFVVFPISNKVSSFTIEIVSFALSFPMAKCPHVYILINIL